MQKYISEKSAIEILSSITSKKINETLMKELADCGVIPAYIKFRPKNKVIYPGKSFSFVCNEIIDELTVENSYETVLKKLPFPLREGGMLRTSQWRSIDGDRIASRKTFDILVMVARSDGQLEPVSDQHYARVYTLPEIHQSKENVIQYIDEDGEYQPAIHSYCEECIEVEDGDDVEEGKIILQAMSPFTDDPKYQSKKRHRTVSSTPMDAPVSSGESKRSELVTISALLKITMELSTERGGRKLTQEDIIKKILKDFPTATSVSTLQKLFKEANKTRKVLVVEARQRFAELNELATRDQG